MTVLDLPNLEVLGATVKDSVLYLAQGQTDYGGYAWRTDGTEGKRSLTVSAYDLAALPAVRLLGTVSTSVPRTYGALTAHWPSPGLLVWVGSRSKGWSGPIYYAMAAAATSSDRVGLPGIWYPRWSSPNAVDFAAFDFTRPQTPRFLSTIEVGEQEQWQLSSAFDGEGMLYLSYKVLAGNLVSPPKVLAQSSDAQDPAIARVNRHYLLRVDFAEPRNPVIDDTRINLPGTLRGVARDGRILFTTGQNYDITKGTTALGSALHASAFDGALVHLLDVVPLASASQPTVLRGETVFTLETQPEQIWKPGPYVPILMNLESAKTAPDDGVIADRIGWGGSWQSNSKTSLLTMWQLDALGKFAKIADAAADHDTTLAVFDNLVVTQDYGRGLHLFDASASLENLGSFTFDGWSNGDLSNADGGLQMGLWVPLGQYGVETVATPEE